MQVTFFWQQLPPAPGGAIPLWVDVLLRTAALLLPLIAVGIGWRVVAKQADIRERRRDIREQIAGIKERTAALSVSISTYYGTVSLQDAPAVAVQIKTSLRSLGSALKGVNTSGLLFDYSNLLADVRMAATGGDFDSVNRNKSNDTVRIVESGAAIDDLIDALEARYFETHQIRLKASPK